MAEIESVKIDENQYLISKINAELYGLNIQNVKEILEYGSITMIPMVPDYIKGVINLRGSVVPIIDLSARFGWDVSEITKLSCIIIVEVTHQEEEMDIGILVDAVSEVVSIPESDIGPPPNFGAKIRTEFISGMGQLNEQFIILLHAEKVLNVEELSQLSDIPQQE